MVEIGLLCFLLISKFMYNPVIGGFGGFCIHLFFYIYIIIISDLDISLFILNERCNVISDFW